MTTAQKIEAAQVEFKEHQARGAAYFSASKAYAKALGRGDATSAQRLELLALKAAYYA